MNTQIRQMLRADKAAVIEMMRVFYTSPAVLSNGSEEIFENDFENCVNENPYLEGYVFDCGGEVAGYAMLAKSFSTEFGKPCVWIEDIYVKEEYRGQGIGTAFFAFLDENYKNCIFRLEAESENENAIRVYEKCGFEVLPYLELKK